MRRGLRGARGRDSGLHPALTTTALDLSGLMTAIANGRDSMPGFGRALRPEDLHDVAAFILEELGD